MKHKLLLGAAGLLILGGGVAAEIFTPDTVTLDTATAKGVVWNKPTTDAQWAEDVKKENFDIKSTGVLETMIEAHTTKLEREIQALKKYEQCPECIYYEFYEGLIDSGYTEEDAVAEAAKQRDEATAQRKWSVEKLQQSIERMNKEVELREKGFVVVEGEKKPKNLLGSSVPPDRIRHIHD
jgi:hypothetical protein